MDVTGTRDDNNNSSHNLAIDQAVSDGEYSLPQ